MLCGVAGFLLLQVMAAVMQSFGCLATDGGEMRERNKTAQHTPFGTHSSVARRRREGRAGLALERLRVEDGRLFGGGGRGVLCCVGACGLRGQLRQCA